jgi:hypothetical protein
VVVISRPLAVPCLFVPLSLHAPALLLSRALHRHPHASVASVQCRDIAAYFCWWCCCCYCGCCRTPRAWPCGCSVRRCRELELTVDSLKRSLESYKALWEAENDQ